MSLSIWSSDRPRYGMPRGRPSVGPSSVGLVYIGFFAGALRSHSREVDPVEAVRRDPLEVARARTPPAGASHTKSRQTAVSRSNEAPANVLRDIRWVRFGAAPAYT